MTILRPARLPGFCDIVLAAAVVVPILEMPSAAAEPSVTAVAERPAPRVTRIIGVAPRAQSCEEQVWPYIDTACLTAIAERKRKEAEASETIKRPHAATAALALPSAPGPAARQSGSSETDGSNGVSSDGEIKPGKANKTSRESRRKRERRARH